MARETDRWMDRHDEAAFFVTANAPAQVTESTERGTLRITQVSAWFKWQVS